LGVNVSEFSLSERIEEIPLFGDVLLGEAMFLHFGLCLILWNFIGIIREDELEEKRLIFGVIIIIGEYFQVLLKEHLGVQLSCEWLPVKSLASSVPLYELV